MTHSPPNNTETAEPETATIQAAVEIKQQHHSFARFAFKQGAKRGAFAATVLTTMMMIPFELYLALDAEVKRPAQPFKRAFKRWLLILSGVSLVGAVIGGLFVRVTGRTQVGYTILSKEEFDYLIEESKHLTPPEEKPDGQHVQRLNAEKSKAPRSR
ncbi:MAG: hypothetical protein ABSF34_20805 [Verrucomicrobiota bacterium]